jgi:hypothetical protein
LSIFIKGAAPPFILKGNILSELDLQGFAWMDNFLPTVLRLFLKNVFRRATLIGGKNEWIIPRPFPKVRGYFMPLYGCDAANRSDSIF